MIRLRLTALSPLIFICCALTGCSTVVPLTAVSHLPDEYQVREVAKADSARPFAISRDGALAAVVDKGINIFSAEGKVVAIPMAQAIALSFSPTGEKLAAALPAGPADPGTILRIFDRRGNVIGETKTADKVTTVLWRNDAEVLAAALKITRYSFGADIASSLYRWDGVKPPTATPLASSTVRPQLAKLSDDKLLTTLSMAVSPLGDEIAYTAIKDPPVFTPYLRIITRHLESGSEHEVGKTSVGSGGPLYMPDSESVVVGDNHAMTRRLSIPDGRELDAWPSPGTYPAISPSGNFVFLDGAVYHEGRTVASFPTKSKGGFLPDGSGLAISYEGKLYRVSGLHDQGAPAQPADQGRLLQLRRLRSMGLISEKEYRTQRQKVMAR